MILGSDTFYDSQNELSDYQEPNSDTPFLLDHFYRFCNEQRLNQKCLLHELQ